MKINYLDDEDLSFLHRCSEEHLETFTRILTHNENGKPRLSSALLRNENFQAMAGHPERYRRNWQLIAGELQHAASSRKVLPGNFAGRLQEAKNQSRKTDVYAGNRAVSSGAFSGT